MTLTPNPGFVLLFAAALTLLTPARLRPLLMVLSAFAAIYLMFEPPFGDTVTLAEIGLAVTPLRLDAQSQVFGLCFALLTAIIALFSSYRRDRIEDALLMTLAGAAMTGVFVGDFIGFVAASSLAGLAGAGIAMSVRGGVGGLGAGVRMLIWQGAAALLMTAGVGLIWANSRSVDFDIVEAAAPGGALLFAGLLIQAGAPGAHVWVKDAVARASPVGAAALAAFPRTLAIYAIVRAFPGEPALIPIGAAMALLPLPFAAAARDLRVALAYGAVSQTGAALIAIGAATPLAVGGAGAYAFACALHGALALMAIGFAYQRIEGDGRALRVGGLARSMPITAALAVIAGLSALGAPFFAGFAGYSVIGSAVANEGRWLAWLALTGSAAGAVTHAGLRAPYEVFFGPDTGARPAEAPFMAQLAMGLAGFFCLAIGTNPGWLYELLPESIFFHPYEGHFALTQLQLIVAAALMFVLARMARLYPTPKSGEIPDLDWLLRAPVRSAGRGAIYAAAAINSFVLRRSEGLGAWAVKASGGWLARADRPARDGAASAFWLIAATAMLLCCLYLFQTIA